MKKELLLAFPGFEPTHLFNSIQFIHTFINIYNIYSKVGIHCNKEEEEEEEEEGEEKKKINGLDRSVRWSEELSFRANHRYVMSGNTQIMCAWCHGNYELLCQ